MLAGIVIALVGLVGACALVVLATTTLGHRPPTPVSAATPFSGEGVPGGLVSRGELEAEIEQLRRLVLQLRLDLSKAQRLSISRDLELRRDMSSFRALPAPAPLMADERAVLAAIGQTGPMSATVTTERLTA
jgi:hypothetical protein